ncbi:tRNA-splicing endonuclease subunit Sen54 N-terminal domain-containing protein [Caenorhabditis elegans]|uniref:tRNA-splicing endonuclease subunit Sen54 N-terminal domain-containing protein n=1 Tax=Caenorhabditis elegans TaxID=6239 RepID=Q9TXV5_CAEEL|nr:tRNA-splicing endonuclease subunit Sen54 N-terminal domain-containing protein [Caenorhabditis elegans]CCD71626.1 tRNA-splicing endonuclease subunit Sen54 N-terminal domain-containing protein [Caenorhabditis elegans]|eukprot:NP_500146.1 Trna (tRNA) Splicing ENdonuclease subunit related [Caenorhabditis elegans]
MAEWNRAKRKRKTIEIQYTGLASNSTLKVTKVTGKHLESMGIPGKFGYEVYPEEAVYLMETGSATISTSSGRDLSLLEAFSILEAMSVPMSKYEAYKHVKRTGLVVLRPRKPTIDFERLRHVEPKIRQKFAEKSFEMLVNRHTVPEERVPNPDSFPSFENRNGQISMKMKVLHTSPALVNFLPLEMLESIQTSTILQNLKPPTPNRPPCRPPSYWPFVDHHVTNWQEFRFQAEQARQETVLRRLKKLRPPSHAELRRERITVENVDFHVFSPASFSHRLPARPLFSLICYSATGPPLKISELAELENVVFAMEEAGKVNFVAMSGASIDLNNYLC